MKNNWLIPWSHLKQKARIKVTVCENIMGQFLMNKKQKREVYIFINRLHSILR